MEWSCPRCRAQLEARDSVLHCGPCARDFPVIAGIPDLRADPVPGLDFEKDRAEALELAAFAEGQPVEAVVRRVFGARGWREDLVELRTRQTLDAPERLRSELRDWLAPAAGGSGRFVDLGCGPGMLLAAAAAEGRGEAIGIDVSLVWLVVARHMVRHRGGEAHLAAAMGEGLPLPDRSVTGVISLDVIEHVTDPRQYLAEIDRVLAPGGHIALSTPNRFSLTAEPHVKVWGVGWLPRRLQKPYAEWRSGSEYDSTVLLSLFELRQMMRSRTSLDFDVVLAQVSREEIRHFPLHRALAARVYNRVIALPPVTRVLKPISPFYRIVAHRPMD